MNHLSFGAGPGDLDSGAAVPPNQQTEMESPRLAGRFGDPGQRGRCPSRSWIAACAAVLPGLFCSADGNPAERPNVLFIAVDDLKPWLGCYGHPVIKTPNIDRIASMGTVFRQNYCQVAVCGPTRISLLTGLRPDTTQVYNMGGEVFHLDTARKRAPHLKTIPGWFKDNGYTAIGFGKVFDGRNTDPGQDRRSWSDPKGVRWEWDNTLWPESPARGGYQNPETRRRIEEALKEAERRGIKNSRAVLDFLSTVEGTRPVCESMDLPDEAYAEGNVMAPPAVQAIRRFGKSGGPFFLAVGFYKPHLPFTAPKKYWDLYSPEDFMLEPVQSYPENGVQVAETGYIEGRGFHPVPVSGPIPEELQRHMMHGYAACVSYVDAQIGKLLQALEEQNLLDKTIICLWGDHGFHLGDKQIWGKHTNFEEATRAPLIIASPAMTGGRAEEEFMTEFIDVFPTLCELAGLEAPEGLAGKSLAGLMRGERLPVNRPAVSQYMRDADGQRVMGWAVRDRRYRYVEWRNITPEGGNFTLSGEVIGRELYDYDADPHETRSRAGDPEYSVILQEMIRQFDDVLSHLPARTEDGPRGR